MGGWNFTGITVCKEGVAYWVGGTSLVLQSVRREWLTGYTFVTAVKQL